MVYVVILNWNGWKDTIVCLESVLRSTFHDFKVIVCDNDSSDHSLERIEEWANGAVTAECSNQALSFLINPPLHKPIRFSRLCGDASGEMITRSEQLILVQTGRNLGFAGGVNVGLRMALRSGDSQYAWILNNDTLVEPQAMEELVRRMEQSPSAGMCGSTLLYFSNPDIIQSLGGSEYNQWLSRSTRIFGRARVRNNGCNPAKVERRLDYVAGASMLVRRESLERVGLLSEHYFLYFEEIDWALRARSKATLAYAPKSIVYHKEGASTGSNTFVSHMTPSSDFYSTRNRLIVTRKYFPAAIVTTTMAVALKALLSTCCGRWANSSAIVRGIVSGLSFEADDASGV